MARLLVSISVEKPIPWRRRIAAGDERARCRSFNLCREANPLATSTVKMPWSEACLTVSISVEKPIPWRPNIVFPPSILGFQSLSRSQSPGDGYAVRKHSAIHSFNLCREANPLATASVPVCPTSVLCSFNLCREANPLATSRSGTLGWQSPLFVSISVEKPIPWRQMQYARRIAL